jgi:hypothetical protein
MKETCDGVAAVDVKSVSIVGAETLLLPVVRVRHY